MHAAAGGCGSVRNKQTGRALGSRLAALLRKSDAAHDRRCVLRARSSHGGTTVGFLTVVFAIMLWRFEPRRWMRNLGLIAVGGVILQGVLGGLTVLFLLPKPVSIGHACLAQLFFCTTVAMAVFTSGSWRREPEYVADHGWPSLRSLAVLTCILILAQLALGAAFRHKAAGVMPHIIGAMVVLAAIVIESIFIVSQYPKHELLRNSALVLMLIGFVQIMLGVAAYVARVATADALQVPWITVIFTVLHVAVGAATFGASVIVALQVFRNVQ